MLADFAKGSGRYRGGSLYYHEGYLPTPDTLGAVPQARTINSKPLTSDITLSAADVGALPVAGGTVSGVLGVTGELHLVGYSAGNMADIVWRAPDGTERGRLWIGGTIGADNSLTWRSGASGAFLKIYHEGNKPTAAEVGAMADGGTYRTVYFNNWIRTVGACGWYNETYGGGLYMIDSAWIRTYNGKKIHIPNAEGDSFYTLGGVLADGAGNFGDVYIRSDKRLKTNLVPLSDALEKVCKLAGYEYDKKKCLSATEYDVHEAGLIAQDVQAVLPAATSEVNSATASGNEENVLTISHGGVIALLVEAVKELSEKVKELEHGRT